MSTAPASQSSASEHLSKVTSLLKAGQSAQVRELIDWLKIPSISTDPQYKKDCIAAAQWVPVPIAEVAASSDLAGV